MSKGYLLLKWGTLKGWEFETKKGKALFKKYADLGMTLGAMSQDDTPEQKKLICKMIDEVDTVQNDWTGEYYKDKQKAKDYVMNYGKDS